MPSTMLVHLHVIPTAMVTLLAPIVTDMVRQRVLHHHGQIVMVTPQPPIVTDTVIPLVHRQPIPIHLVTQQPLIVIGMAIPLVLPEVIPIVMVTPRHLILTDTDEAQAHQIAILIHMEIQVRPLGILMDNQ